MITGWSTQTSRIDKNTGVLMIRLSKCSMALACPDHDKEAGDSFLHEVASRKRFLCRNDGVQKKSNIAVLVTMDQILPSKVHSLEGQRRETWHLLALWQVHRWIPLLLPFIYFPPNLYSSLPLQFVSPSFPSFLPLLLCSPLTYPLRCRKRT